MSNSQTTVWGYEPLRARAGSWFPLEIKDPLNAGATGGTSTVHAITTRYFEGYAAKIFAPSALSGSRRLAHHAKISAVAGMSRLLRNGYLGGGKLRAALPYVTWPELILYDQRAAHPDHLIGFAMRRIDDGHPLMVMATPKHRKKVFGTMSQSDLLGVATLIADRLDCLHGPNGDRGIVFGDLAPRNVLISPALEVTLIDADSYQYRGSKVMFATQDSTPGHRAPRIAKAALAGGLLPPLTIEDDAYALAILLFYLLVDGAYPFRTGSSFEIDGRTPDDEENMLAGRFPYTDPATLKPPKIKLQTYLKLPEPIRQLFEEAFVGGKPPAPSRWVATLADVRLSNTVPASTIQRAA